MIPLTPIINPGMLMLDAVDRLARATDRWVQHGVTVGQFSSLSGTPGAHQELAAGIIAGLCDAFELDSHHQLFALYSYMLLSGAAGEAAETARGLAAISAGNSEPEYYHQGRAEAAALITSLQRPMN